MAFVYWIHLPEHTDLSSQGYVGVTTTTVSVRYQGHLKAMRRKDRPCPIVGKAIKKYGSSIRITPLLEGSEDYCYHIEELLRPTERVGWNTTAGGKRPARGFLGLQHTLDSKKKMADSQKQAWASKLENKTAPQFKHLRPQPVDLSVEFKRYKCGRRPDIWQKAGEMYLIFTKEDGRVLPSVISERCGFPKTDQTVKRIVKGFLAGWNPFSDEIWLERFYNGTQT